MFWPWCLFIIQPSLSISLNISASEMFGDGQSEFIGLFNKIQFGRDLHPGPALSISKVAAGEISFHFTAAQLWEGSIRKTYFMETGII